MKKVFIFLVSFLLLTTTVTAQKKTFKQPIHLDDSGKPMVNSWQKNEYQRQQKKQLVTPLTTTTGCKVLENGQLDPNCKIKSVLVQTTVPSTTNAPLNQGTVTVVDAKGDVQVMNSATVIEGSTVSTPTSVLVNRPVQVKVDPKSKTINP